MHRFALDYLHDWKVRPQRKPLVVRGARQVGKSTLVRLFAKESFQQLAEINFERNPEVAGLFVSKNPRKILQLLELHFESSIEPGRTLLFLDEIQATPEVFSTLRYFLEELPELHVVAAGSLLEFILGRNIFSMPVGRIEYLHLGPMQFEEFLLAAGKSKLCRFIQSFSLDNEIPAAIHNQLMDLLNIFLIVGGMPEAVGAYIENSSYLAGEAVKNSILATYQDDFNKYGQQVNYMRLRKVFMRIPSLIGQKFKYAHVDREQRAKDIGLALEQLTHARVAYKVCHASANGVPLGAEVNEHIFKAVFLDVGLVTTATGLSILDLEGTNDILLVNAGALCEQFVGQHLLYSGPFNQEPQLHYWVREKKNSSAEIDYVISEGTHIIPIEVKAGKSGTLKSLHLFLREKKRDFALRLCSLPPSSLNTHTALMNGNNVPYHLLSLPLYLVGQVRRLGRELLSADRPFS